MLRSVLNLEQLLAMTPDDAAAFWLVRQDGGDDSHDDVLFQEWLDADPAHGFAWADACSLWEGLGQADQADLDALREAASAERSGRNRWGMAAAASIALVVAASGALFFRSGDVPSGPTVVAARSQTFASATGQRRTITLPDKSMVTLNTDTAIAVAYVPGGRHVQLLRGQAFFAVAHDPGRPFVVENAGRTVTDIGTRFEVRALGNATRVILVEGRVRVAAPIVGETKIVELEAGQQLDADARTVSVSAANPTIVADWQQGLVTFHDTTLSDAVAELNRYATGKPLLIHDPKIAAIRISGAFHTDDLRKFARTIAEIYPVRIIETANAIEIASSGRPGR